MRLTPRLRLLAVVTAFAPLLLVGCAAGGAEQDEGATRTVESAYGAVEVPATVERVAAVSYDTPWQLMSVGVQPIASIDYSQWAANFTAEQLAFVQDAAVIGTFGEINYEAIAAAAPDLIVGDMYEVDQQGYERLSEIAPTVIVGGDARGDWQALTEQTALAVDRHDEWAAGRDAYETRRDEIRSEYADVISSNRWITFSLGDDATQFSVQLPTGSTGNLVVNELGMTYGPNVPLEDATGSGYASISVERVGTVFDGVTAALTFENMDGTPIPLIEDIMATDLFQQTEVAKSGHVYKLRTIVSDYDTALAWLNEVEEKVLAPLAG